MGIVEAIKGYVLFRSWTMQGRVKRIGKRYLVGTVYVEGHATARVFGLYTPTNRDNIYCREHTDRSISCARYILTVLADGRVILNKSEMWNCIRLGRIRRAVVALLREHCTQAYEFELNGSLYEVFRMKPALVLELAGDSTGADFNSFLTNYQEVANV
jgi:hypothetical protein